MSGRNDRLGRRKFLEMGVATGVAAAGASWPGRGIAQLAHPHEGSLDYLDRNQYIHNMELLNVFMPGEPREGKMQMMAIGDRRLLFQGAWIPGSPSPKQSSFCFY